MNISAINRIGTLLLRVLDSKKATEPVVATQPQKPTVKLVKRVPLERRTPEECGVPSSLIEGYINEIKRDRTLNMHNIMILRGDKVIFECSFDGQDLAVPKMTFSACKSIVSLAVGMLIGDGALALDTKITDIFGDKIKLLDKRRFDDITIENILTMQSGIVFNEAEALISTDWVKGYLSSAISGKIGETFSYNSLNTYILSAAVKEITGKSLCDFLRERLFEPLEIYDYDWEKCPMGIEKGGWGLYIRPEDMAKIAILVRDGGVWRGTRLVSEEYIKSAISAHAFPPHEYGAFDYGYQIWVGRHTDTFLFNGMLGQNVLCFKESGIIIISNAGNGELFQQGGFYPITLSAFSGAFPGKLPPDRFAELRLKKLKRTLLFGGGMRRLPEKKNVFAALKNYFSYDYETDDDCAPSLSLMPTVLSLAQNNFSTGAAGIRFELDEKAMLINITFEEVGEKNTVRAGLIRGLTDEIKLGGESYKVNTFAKLAYDEDGDEVFVVRIDFTETPFSRIFKFYFSERGVVCRAEEKPGADFVIKLVGDTLDELYENKLISLFAGKFDRDYVFYKFHKVLEPVIFFKKTEKSSV